MRQPAADLHAVGRWLAERWRKSSQDVINVGTTTICPSWLRPGSVAYCIAFMVKNRSHSEELGRHDPFHLDGSCGVCDEASLRLSPNLRSTRGPVVGRDPAFRCRPWWGREHTVSGSPRWKRCVPGRLNQCGGPIWLRLRSAAVGTTQLLLPIPGFDSELSSRTARRLRKDFGLSAELSEIVSVHQARRLLSDAHLVIGMRLHALIMGAAEGTPGVAISYDPKVEAFASEAGLPWISLQPLHTASGAERLYQMIIAAWQARSDIRSRLRQHAKLRQEAVGMTS